MSPPVPIVSVLSAGVPSLPPSSVVVPVERKKMERADWAPLSRTVSLELSVEMLKTTSSEAPGGAIGGGSTAPVVVLQALASLQTLPGVAVPFQ